MEKENNDDLIKELIEKYQRVAKQRVHLMAWVAAFLGTESETRITCLLDLKKELVTLVSSMIDKDAMVKDKIDLEVAERAKTVCAQIEMLNLFKEDKDL